MAQVNLRQQGYKVGGQVFVHSGKPAENLVLGQDPLPAEAGARDGRRGLLVTRGSRPPVFVMPDCVGRTEEEAKPVLARAGLCAAAARREASPVAAPGTILRQRPESGYPVQPGDLITLVVADSVEGGDDE